jgi:hypothetical protein
MNEGEWLIAFLVAQRFAELSLSRVRRERGELKSHRLESSCSHGEIADCHSDVIDVVDLIRLDSAHYMPGT